MARDLQAKLILTAEDLTGPVLEWVTGKLQRLARLARTAIRRR